MKLDYLIRNFRPVYPASGVWDDTVSEMLADSHEKAIVDYLCDVLRSGKGFREPVMVGIGYYGETDEDETLEFSVLNGTHRIVAHIITGVQEVFTVDEDYSEPAYEPDDLLETVVDFISPVSDVDSLFDLLRSFPLDENVWVESNMGAVDSSQVNMVWDCAPSEGLADRINEAVVARLHAAGFRDFIANTKVVDWLS